MVFVKVLIFTVYQNSVVAPYYVGFLLTVFILFSVIDSNPIKTVFNAYTVFIFTYVEHFPVTCYIYRRWSVSFYVWLW